MVTRFGEYLQDWAAGSNLRSALASGGLFGGFGVVAAVVTGGGAVGVVAAVVAGALFGGAMGSFGRKTTGDLSGLSSQQRSAVIRAVRRGEAPADASLAEAVVRRSQKVQEQASRRWPWIVLGSFACVFLLDTVRRASAGSLGIEDLLGALWPAFIAYLWWASRRSIERASRAEAAAVRSMRPGAG